MSRIVGIDLGTCYSAVVVPEIRGGDHFLTLRECPGCSVILDAGRRRITPSVVAEDENGELIVGYAAKSRAGFSPEPIMFSKRWMGEQKLFQLNKRGALRPEEAAAEVLRYLKKIAEEQLGEPVDEAVITVPAYFSLRAKQMTKKAAQLAGLRVAQIAQEPVAAALMYCSGDARDSLRIMTYDLGGGTFDVAILEKKDGVISTSSIKAFDGDRFLGGYELDKQLVFWMLDRLNEQGFNLRLDWDNPADKVPFAKLMIYAERAKIALSDVLEHTITENSTGIMDRHGKPIPIQLTIRRTEFEELIRPHVERTIQLCRRAMLEKAKPAIRHDQIDEIIMVGGSSRIPLIGRRLEAEFGKKPRLIEPDLCVALGAAILARSKAGMSMECLKLDPIPAETELTMLTVTGRVVPGKMFASPQGCSVKLRALDGSYQSSRSPGTEGAFAFDGVPMAPNAETGFVLSVTSPSGTEVACHRFAVTQTSEAKGGGLVEANTNVLSKPISVVWVGGAEIVAPERTPLPYDKVVEGVTSDTSGQIRIPIQEENTPLGEILVTDVPTSLPVGSAIEITLSIQETYEIHGRAYIPALGRETTVVIPIPERAQKTVEELERDFTELRAKAEDALATAAPGAVFSTGRKLREQIKRCERMLAERGNDPASIQDCLDEVYSLLRELGSDWKADPPRAAFDQKAAQAAELLEQVIQEKPEVRQEGFDKQILAIRAEADKAYKSKQSALWKESFEKIENVCSRLKAKVASKQGKMDPVAVIMLLAQEFKALEDFTRQNGRYELHKGEFQQLATSLKNIHPKDSDFDSKVHDWYFTKFSDLRQRLHAPAGDGPGKLKKKGAG